MRGDDSKLGSETVRSDLSLDVVRAVLGLVPRVVLLSRVFRHFRRRSVFVLFAGGSGQVCSRTRAQSLRFVVAGLSSLPLVWLFVPPIRVCCLHPPVSEMGFWTLRSCFCSSAGSAATETVSLSATSVRATSGNGEAQLVAVAVGKAADSARASSETGALESLETHCVNVLLPTLPIVLEFACQC